VVEKLVIASLVVRCQIAPSAVQGKTLAEVIEVADRSLENSRLSPRLSESGLEDGLQSHRLKPNPKS
jgi:hypothetical protein